VFWKGGLSALGFGSTPPLRHDIKERLVNKKFVVLVCLLVSAYANASTVTLTWTQSDSPGIVYNKVYCGYVSGGPYPWRRKTSDPATSLKVLNVNSGTYYCMVTAIDGQGIESVASNEVKVVVP
jgi:hypothetical protein